MLDIFGRHTGRPYVVLNIMCHLILRGNHMGLPVVMQYYIAAKTCFEFIAQSPYSACQATAAVKQAFAECIIKSQCLFRADNICPYGWRMHAAFDVVGAAVYPPAPDKAGFSDMKNRNGAKSIPITAIPNHRNICTAGTLAKRYLRRRRFPRKRLVMSQRRYEGACNRIADANVTFCEKEE